MHLSIQEKTSSYTEKNFQLHRRKAPTSAATSSANDGSYANDIGICTNGDGNYANDDDGRSSHATERKFPCRQLEATCGKKGTSFLRKSKKRAACPKGKQPAKTKQL